MTMSPPSLLGPAALPHDDLTAVVAASLGRRLELDDWWVEPVDYDPGTPSTGALLHVRGTGRDQGAGEPLPWSVFVKVLHSPRHWEHLHLVPPDARQRFVDSFPWRVEAEALASDLPGRLPPGIRTPRVFRIDELGDDRVALWLEDVVVADTGWDLPRYARAARVLGRWAARRSGALLPAELRAISGIGLRLWATGRLQGAFADLRDDRLWAHPLVAATADPALRGDLLVLAARVPAMLDRLDTLLQAVGHGDASPQNLLVSAADPDTFVAIDISWQCPQAVGFDLGQLLVGLAHAGELPASALPEVHAVLLPAFVEGLREEGCQVAEADAAYGFEASLLLRSGFTAIPFQRLGEPEGPELAAELAQRVALTRFIADLGLALPR